MFGLGMPELMLIAGIALIIFGPSKLPEMGKAMGKTIGEFRKATSEIKEEISVAVKPEESVKMLKMRSLD